MQPPSANEYRPYFSRYIQRVQIGSFIDTLNNNTQVVIDTFGSISEDKHDYRYAAEKWSIKQMLTHITDIERVMNYRALVAARNDTSALLPAMEQDLYADNAKTAHRSLHSIIEEFATVRASTRTLFMHMNDEETKRTANVDGQKTSARALGYIIIGHAIHHLNILKERYL